MGLGDALKKIDGQFKERVHKKVEEQGGVDLSRIISKSGRMEIVRPISFKDVADGKPVFRASAFSRLCMRQEVLCSVYGIERRVMVNAKLGLIFDVGHYLHDMIRERYLAPAGILFGKVWQCKSCGKIVDSLDGPPVKCPPKCKRCGGKVFVYYESEVFNKEYLISGHVDGFIGQDAPDAILEIKTSNDDYFKRSLQYEPAPAHILQMQIYMWLSGYQKGYLFYFDKNDSELKVFTIPFNSRAIDQVRSFIDEFKTSMAGEGTELPKQVVCATTSDKMARECPVIDKCFDRTQRQKGE